MQVGVVSMLISGRFALHVIEHGWPEQRINKVMIDALEDIVSDAATEVRKRGHKCIKIYTAKPDLKSESIEVGRASRDFAADALIVLTFRRYRNTKMRYGMSAWCENPLEVEGLLSHMIYSSLLKVRLEQDEYYIPADNRGIKKIYLNDKWAPLVRNALCPTTVIYLASVGNEHERNFIITHKKMLAFALADGIRDYARTNYAQIMQNLKGYDKL